MWNSVHHPEKGSPPMFQAGGEKGSISRGGRGRSVHWARGPCLTKRELSAFWRFPQQGTAEPQTTATQGRELSPTPRSGTRVGLSWQTSASAKLGKAMDSQQRKIARPKRHVGCSVRETLDHASAKLRREWRMSKRQLRAIGWMPAQTLKVGDARRAERRRVSGQTFLNRNSRGLATTGRQPSHAVPSSICCSLRRQDWVPFGILPRLRTMGQAPHRNASGI
jgi:hypothetical protein